MSDRIAAIDIGTNTCLMLIAENENGRFKTITDLQRIPRIGRNVDKEKNISPHSIKKLIEVLQEYKKICEENTCERIIAAGTSALRDARNRNEVIEEVFRETGIKIEIVSGEQEAIFSYKGAVSGLEKDVADPIVIDIGGGSTEICYIENNELVRRSLDIGSVRITEKFFSKDNCSELTSAQEFIRREFNELSDLALENRSLVGVAGTVTTLSLMKHGHKVFTTSIQNDILSEIDVNDICEKLSKLNNEEILKFGSYMKDRSDIIFAGTLILNEFLKYSKLDKVIVSLRGFRYGLALKELLN